MDTTQKGKTIPVTDRGGLYSCETSRIAHYLDSHRADGDEFGSLALRPHFTPRSLPVLISVKG
jgi:hypothetical protein